MKAYAMLVKVYIRKYALKGWLFPSATMNVQKCVKMFENNWLQNDIPIRNLYADINKYLRVYDNYYYDNTYI